MRRRRVSDRLWCVHMEGLDDFIAMSSREQAVAEASSINAYIDRFENGRRAALVRAVVIEWPFSPTSHAQALAEDWHDLQRMPHRQADAHPAKTVLANVAQRVKELIRVARGV
jgi:hypothetical protein